jgi:hypothetical protein
MILIDYSAIAFGSITTLPRSELTEETVRYMILNSIRMYRKKYRAKFGEIVLCLDSGGNWRKEYYPEYKAKRASNRAEDDAEYWAKAFAIINKIEVELKENFPYKVVRLWKCEGDDIIASICEYTQMFGNYEEVMIISADGDFRQLQKWDNIHQYSTITKKPIVEPNPHKFLFEHICKGDGGDGVPNVMSDDKVFIEERRQSNTSQKKIDEWAAAPDPLSVMPPEVARNFQRNEKMIDLSKIPEELKREVINTYENATVAPKKSVWPYLVANCRNLVEHAGDFL